MQPSSNALGEPGARLAKAWNPMMPPLLLPMGSPGFCTVTSGLPFDGFICKSADAMANVQPKHISSVRVVRGEMVVRFFRLRAPKWDGLGQTFRGNHSGLFPERSNTQGGSFKAQLVGFPKDAIALKQSTNRWPTEAAKRPSTNEDTNRCFLQMFFSLFGFPRSPALLCRGL